jgi:hypothetical protein
MQDLTVAGFRLRALEQVAPAAMQPEIGALAVWLSERQAELRDFVSDLIDVEFNSELETQVEALLPGCKVTWERHLAASAAASAALVSALLLLIRATAALGSPQVVRISILAAERLSVAHDGPPLRTRPAALVSLRREIKKLNASLRVARPSSIEILSVTWGSR